MIVNPGKFQAAILDKKKNNHTQEMIKINNKVSKTSHCSNWHIANICRSAANQLNVLDRIRKS